MNRLSHLPASSDAILLLPTATNGGIGLKVVGSNLLGLTAVSDTDRRLPNDPSTSSNPRNRCILSTGTR